MSLAGKLAVNVSAVALGRLVLVGTGLLSVGLATRYLGLDSFGALAAATAFSALLPPLIDIGLSQIGAREISRHPERTAELLGVILTVGLLMVGVVAGVGFAVAELVYGGGGEDGLIRQGILLMLIPIPIAAPVAAANAYLVSEQRAYMTTFASVGGSAVTVSGIGLAIALDAGFTGVMLAYSAHLVGYGAVMLLAARGHLRYRLNFDIPLWRRMLGWSMPLGLAAIVHSLYARIDLLLLSVLSTGSQLALYGLAYKLIEAFYLLPYIVMQTLLPEMSRLAGSPRELYTLLRDTFASVLAVAAPVVVYAGAFATPIMELVGGRGFEGAGTVLQIMMLAVGFFFLTVVFAQVLVAINRQADVLRTWLAVLAFNVGLNLVLIPFWDARGAAAALVASEGIALAVVMLLYRRHGALPRAMRTGRLALAAVTMAVVAIGMESLPLPDIPRLILGGIVALLAYGASLVLLKALPSPVRAVVRDRLPRRFALER